MFAAPNTSVAPDFRITADSPQIRRLKYIGTILAFTSNAIGMFSAGVAAAVLFYAFLNSIMEAAPAMLISIFIGISAYVGKVPIMTSWSREAFQNLLINLAKEIAEVRTQGIRPYLPVLRIPTFNIRISQENLNKIPHIILGLLISVGKIMINMITPAVYAYLVVASYKEMADKIEPFSSSAADAFRNPWLQGISVVASIIPNLFSPPGILAGGRFLSLNMLKHILAIFNKEAMRDFLLAQAKLNFTRNLLTQRIQELLAAVGDGNIEALKNILQIFEVILQNGVANEFRLNPDYQRMLDHCRGLGTLLEDQLWKRLAEILVAIKNNPKAINNLEEGLAAYATHEHGFKYGANDFSLTAANLRTLGALTVVGLGIASLSNLVLAAGRMMSALLENTALAQDHKDNIGYAAGAFMAFIIVSMSFFIASWGDAFVRKGIQAFNLTRGSYGQRLIMPESPEQPQILRRWQINATRMASFAFCAAGGGFNAWVAQSTGQIIFIIVTALWGSYALEYEKFKELLLLLLERNKISEALKGGNNTNQDLKMSLLMSLLTWFRTNALPLGAAAAPRIACLEPRATGVAPVPASVTSTEPTRNTNPVATASPTPWRSSEKGVGLTEIAVEAK